MHDTGRMGPATGGIGGQGDCPGGDRCHREPVRPALLRVLCDAPSIARDRRSAPEPVERQLRLLEGE